MNGREPRPVTDVRMTAGKIARLRSTRKAAHVRGCNY